SSAAPLRRRRCATRSPPSPPGSPEQAAPCVHPEETSEVRRPCIGRQGGAEHGRHCGAAAGLRLGSRRAPGMKLQYNRHASGRLFENAFLERSSRVKPVTPFLFYIPIIVTLQIWAL